MEVLNHWMANDVSGIALDINFRVQKSFHDS